MGSEGAGGGGKSCSLSDDDDEEDEGGKLITNVRDSFSPDGVRER